MTTQYEMISNIDAMRASDGTYAADCVVGGRTHNLAGFATIDALLACCGELIAQDLRQRKTLELPKAEL